MVGLTVQRRWSWTDLVLGVVLVLAGIALVGYSTWATKVSVVFVGWTLLALGLVSLAGAFRRMGRSSFWSTALGGALLTALGLVFVRNPGLGAVTLTLMAGMVFLVGGLVRLVAAAQDSESRLPLLVAGLASSALGLVVVFNLFTASFSLLGLVLAIETISEGVVMMMFGRQRVSLAPLHEPTAVAH